MYYIYGLVTVNQGKRMLKTVHTNHGVYICLGFLTTCLVMWTFSSLSEKDFASLLSDKSPKELGYNEEQINTILRDCGRLCDTTSKGLPGPYFNHIRAPFDCTALFKNEIIDLGHKQFAAPKEIPDGLMNSYTMNNRIGVKYWYFNERVLGQSHSIPVWTVEHINILISLAKQGILEGTYGLNDTNSLRDGLVHTPGIQNGRVLVIGSRSPWVEACVLEAGAREILTLEYGEIVSKHPQVKTILPSEFRKSFLENTLGVFDAVVTFSSIEHSGLGRFGDMLNPWGDIITIARAWCVTKDNGFLTMGVPYDYENDCLRFNADRVYGKVRYPYLTTNWKQYYRGWGVQRVHVFTKT